jgi:hypothetical protein
MKKITTEEFDRRFDAGEDVSDYIDWSKARRPNKRRRVNVDLPEWMIASLDREADHLGISRQAVIKTWLAERLKNDRGQSG